MFIPTPIFWALSDQQGSRWTLQAEKLNGDMVIFSFEILNWVSCKEFTVESNELPVLVAQFSWIS